MGAYDGAEGCELVGLFLLISMIIKFGKNIIGWYRNDVLALFKNINGHRENKICKEFHQLFNKKGLYLEIECNLKIVNHLDITLDTKHYFKHLHLQTISQT